MTYPIYLFNNTAATLIFNDIGLELPLIEFFEVLDEKQWESAIYKSEMRVAIQQNKVLLYRTDLNYPPLAEDLVTLDGGVSVNLIEGGNSTSIFRIEHVIDFGASGSTYQRNDIIDCGRSI